MEIGSLAKVMGTSQKKEVVRPQDPLPEARAMLFGANILGDPDVVRPRPMSIGAHNTQTGLPRGEETQGWTGDQRARTTQAMPLGRGSQQKRRQKPVVLSTLPPGQALPLQKFLYESLTSPARSSSRALARCPELSRCVGISHAAGTSLPGQRSVTSHRWLAIGHGGNICTTDIGNTINRCSL